MSLERVRAALGIPPFAEVEQDSVALSTGIVSAATVLLGVGLFLGAPALTPEPVPSMVVYAILTVFGLGALGLVRRGRLTAAAHLFSINAFLITTAALVMFGGVSGPTTTSYVLIVIVISRLSGTRAAVLATIACIAASGIMAYLEQIGRFPEPVSPLTPLTAFATVACTVALATIVLFLTSRDILNALELARDNERQLAEHRDDLERMVVDRTARFAALFEQAKVSILDADLGALEDALAARDEASLPSLALHEMRGLLGRVTLTTVNDEALSRFGAEDVETFREALPSLFVEESRPMLATLFGGLVADEDKLEVEGVMRTMDGERLVVVAGFSRVAAADGAARQCIITLADATPLHQAREAAQELAELQASELERISDEVERLFYAVSHDLRSPLRAVANLTEWASEDLKAGKVKEVGEHLDKVLQRVLRLETMMNDVLSFARVGRTKHPVEVVDVAELLDEVADGLVNVPEGFTVTWDELPVLRTEKTLLSQVFVNLVGNAIKHHDKMVGEIRISHRLVNGDHEFCVSDDGPGIPPQHRERVFEMFSTLKRRDQVEGSGMGLAFVHKLVHQRGGRLTLEESDGGGARFRFSWLATNFDSLEPGRMSLIPASTRG